MMFNVRSILHIMQFKKQQNTRKKELDNRSIHVCNNNISLVLKLANY